MGRKTIRELNLFSRFPDRISANASSSTILLAEVLSFEQVDITCGCQPNDDQWRVTKNRQPPWAKSTVDQADILSQIIKHKIVEKSNAAYYNQVLLVPKSDGFKRMCIDCTYVFGISTTVPKINHILFPTSVRCCGE